MSNYEQLSKSIINSKGLIQKLYNRKQQRVGTLVAHKFNDEHFSIGYSLCNPNNSPRGVSFVSSVKGRYRVISRLTGVKSC